MDTSAYRLSRIYSGGWNAAKKSLSDRAEGPRTRPPSTENPHELPEERARWNKGFEDRLRSRTGGEKFLEPPIVASGAQPDGH
jgi:hypothetical protein